MPLDAAASLLVKRRPAVMRETSKGSRGPISLQFSYFFRHNLVDPASFLFDISASRRRFVFPFRYIEQCFASKQPLQSSFNYFINNHYCLVHRSVRRNFAFQEKRRPDNHIFSGWILSIEKIRSLSVYSSRVIPALFQTFVSVDVT